jgi:deoxycytidylate deaminase
MYNAASQASTSACLSRQVGAAIFSKEGELIGVGANDVPKFGGGLYCSEDGAEDHRCFKQTGGLCRNDEHKDLLYKAIFRELRNDGILSAKVDQSAITAALKRTDIKNLIEYSRAVHAEMEAIISVARGNKPGLVGATLFSTTFPCHSCARHIVASGIRRVLYIEPYAKSLANTLHGDAISMVETDNPKRVAFLQYEGVAPKNMIRLFVTAQVILSLRRLDRSRPSTSQRVDGIVRRHAPWRRGNDRPRWRVGCRGLVGGNCCASL